MERGTILIVDDDPAIQKVLERGLRGYGYATYACGNGQEALSLLAAREVDPDCVLLDILMPVMTGLEALPQIKEIKPLAPVIMLTAFNELEGGLRSMKLGAFDYLVKPARLAHVTDTVDRALKYRAVLVANDRLNRENEAYRLLLEQKVADRTRELEQAYRKLRQTNIETVQVLAETIEAKDEYTRGHCQRVRLLSAGTARHLGLAAAEIELLEYAALLHDIGKIGVPESLLQKKDPLTEGERGVINTHPAIGASILRNVAALRPCLPAVRCHHERWDGGGYPDGLAGEAIDLTARIVCVCDAFDAMTTTRSYRRALAPESALRELEREGGRQFDPQVVRAFQAGGGLT